MEMLRNNGSTVLFLMLVSVVCITGQEMPLEPTDNTENKIITTGLSNGKVFPLVGLGVGISQPFMVPLLVTEAMKEDKKTLMFDSSYRSGNEHVLSSGIMNGVRNISRGDEKVTVHVITKVWYTHLGYERTVLSVQDSFKNFKTAIDDKNIDLKIHVLLNWPRCYDSIHFMNCEREEESLSDELKAATSPPHLDRDNAWKQSWKALEDMYTSQEYPIESIGVSNFQLNDMKQFELFATVQPHVLQYNIWSLLYDPELITYCQVHNIHVQAYNVMSMVSTGSKKAPNANYELEKIATELSVGLSTTLTTGQVIQAWLIQHDVSVIPKTTRFDRLYENSALSLGLIPEMSQDQSETVAHSVESFLNGEDLEVFNVLKTSLTKSGAEKNETLHEKDHHILYGIENSESISEQSIQDKLVGHEISSF